MMAAINPDMTMSQVACLIRKSPSWVGSCLSLANLLKAVQVMVNRGEIPCKTPTCWRRFHVLCKSITWMAPGSCRQRNSEVLAAACVKRFTEAVKQGKMDAFYPDKFEAVAHLRSLKEVEEEVLRKNIGALTCTGEGCKSVLDGFYAGLRWVCHLDRA